MHAAPGQERAEPDLQAFESRLARFCIQVMFPLVRDHITADGAQYGGARPVQDRSQAGQERHCQTDDNLDRKSQRHDPVAQQVEVDHVGNVSREGVGALPAQGDGDQQSDEPESHDKHNIHCEYLAAPPAH